MNVYAAGLAEAHRILADRCDELEAAVRYYLTKEDEVAVKVYHQLVEARGSRDVIGRMIERVAA